MRRMPGLYERALSIRPLVAVGQLAVTGERIPRRHRLLATEIARCPHDFVLDLGCGSAPLLRYLRPARYVGVDAHEPSLAVARRRRAYAGSEFVLADLMQAPLAEWRGADVAVISSVTHHLDDDAVVALAERVRDDVAPRRLLLQDAEATGPLGPLVTALDDGDDLRSPKQLIALLSSRFSISTLWTYKNPLRSFHQFLLELAPRESTLRSAR
jgi:SAM-dependent methyltransferase